MEIKEKDYALWLFNVPGIGNSTVEKLLCSGMSCKEIYEMSEKELSKFLSSKQLSNLERSRYSWDFMSEAKKLSDSGIRFVSRIDPEFPEKLKDIPNAPFAIYVKGKLPDPDIPSVSIVGARLCSEYGRYMARLFGQGLAMAGVQVVSGMARGIDCIAQSAALGVRGASFGILGCGVDICYPPENIDVYNELVQRGGLISEYPPGTQPIANYFPMRNRIISALSDVLVVVEARQKSGTQITVDTALEQGREVLAIPGRVTDRLSDGCNSLISQGAGIAISVEDVLDRLWDMKREVKTTMEIEIDKSCEDDEMTEGKELSMEEEILQILDVIPVSSSFILEELYKKGRDISVPVLLSVLMDMTCSGKIVQNGSYYRKIA